MNPSEFAPLTKQFSSEQQSIHRQVEEWRKWWAEVKEFGIPHFGEMGIRLGEIRDKLRAHFEHEERSGFFSGYLQARPNRRTHVEQFVKEHAELLTELNSLISQLRSCGEDEMCWGDARRNFEAFLQRLDQHEHEENRLMEDAREMNPRH